MRILRDRMIEEMKLRNFSAVTPESGLRGRQARQHKSPDQLSKEDIRAFLAMETKNYRRI